VFEPTREGNTWDSIGSIVGNNLVSQLELPTRESYGGVQQTIRAKFEKLTCASVCNELVIIKCCVFSLAKKFHNQKQNKV
jgi:hypothetical protein